MDTEIRNLREESRQESTSHRIHGRVTTPTGRPAAGVLVRAFDRDLRSEEPLGEITTDKNGDYIISYSLDQLKRSEKASADLLVRALADGMPPVSSSIIFNAKPDETVDLIVPDADLSEFEILVQEVTPLLDGVPIAELREDEEHRDVSFLAGETGCSEMHLAYLILAHRHAQSSGLPPEALYGLFREGMPTGLAALQGQSSLHLEAALRAAAKNGFVPASLADKAPETAEQLAAASVAQAQASPLGAVLSLVLPKPEQQESFLKAYLAHQGPPEELWDHLSGTRGFARAGHREKLRLAVELGGLTQNHAPLVQHLFDKAGEARDLAGLSAADWERLVREAGGPPADVPGKDKREKTRLYAQALERTFEEAFPTAAVAARLQAEPRLGKSASAELLAANPDLDLRTANLETFLGEDQKDLKRELQGVQRLFKIAPRFGLMKPLMEAGLDSAHAIAGQSRNAFVEQHAESLGAAQAGRVHDRASRIAATALALVAEHAPAFRGVTLPVLADEAPTAGLTGMPDWETLFGSGDYCECDHCRSVYSPAAYLVDVLDFLKARQVGTTTAKDILFKRRPDLGQIELTCENTNTPLPYVDLVNEILESAVSPATAVAPRQRQTTGTAAELAATPQHVNAGAYDTLKGAVYPWALPFDLGLEECRTYLGALGVPRHQLMEALRTVSQSDLDVAGERSGFSVKERQIVAGKALVPAVDAWEYYGFPDSESGTWTTTISNVRTFLDRTGLVYEDLDGLLALRFVNPERKIVVESSDSRDPGTCDTTKLKLSNLDAPALDRIHRFIRLWRRLGWPMRDLDRAIFALRNGKIEDELLTELAALQRLAAELDLTILRLLAFYAPLDTFLYPGPEEKPLYDQLFLNPAVVKPGPDNPFTLNASRAELKDIGSLENEKALAALRAALSLTGEEITALVAGPDAVVPDRTLNRANLTRLVRSVFLSRALQLRLADGLRLLKLAGIDLDPFYLDPANPAVAPTVPARTLDFVAVAGKLAESGFTLAEMNLLLGGGSDPASPATPPDEALARVLEDIRKGHREIVQSTSETTDSSGEHTRRQLARLGWEPGLIEEALETLRGRHVCTASLNALPAGIVFPEPVRDKVSHDAAAKALRYAGPMTLAERTALLGASADSDYQKAVNALFQAPRSLMKAFLTEADASALFDAPLDFETRLGQVLAKLMPHLGRTLSETLVLQKAVAALGLDRPTGEALFTTWLHSRGATATDPLLRDLLADGFLNSAVPVTRAAFPVQMAALSLAYRVAFVLARLGISALQLPWVIGRATAGWLNLDALPAKAGDPAASFASWLRLLDLVRLRDRLPRGEAALTRVFDLAYRTGTTAEALRQALAEETGWSLTDLTALCDATRFNITLPAGFQDEKALLRLQAAFALLGRFGVAAGRALGWSRTEPTLADALDARQALKARHEPEDWLKVAGPLRDGLRERQRSCLVSYLVLQPGTGQSWKDANGLFRHFLIDVEMSPCQLTSRIKQAISSAQLFVQRCLMNLEAEVKADASLDVGWRDWKWMRNYRVWEAGRKLFLYPESYLEPELRDDKSPFYKELEDELLQQELTDATAEDAFLHYLEKLDAVSRLEVKGVCHQVEPGVDILHVVARSTDTPHQYFHRTRVDGYRWTAWEKIDADVEGDHVILVVWNRRLHLLWPVFTLESEPQTLTVKLDGMPVPAANKFWRIQLAWSERRNGKWQPKKVTRESFETAHGQTPASLSDIYFWTAKNETDGALLVSAGEIANGTLGRLGMFVFGACNGMVVKFRETSTFVMVLPKRTRVWGMELMEADKAALEPLYLGPADTAKALGHTPSLFASPFRLLVDSELDPRSKLFEDAFKGPFFFSDQTRTLFVVPVSPTPLADLGRLESAVREPEEKEVDVEVERLLLGDVDSVPLQLPAGPVKTQGISQLLRPPEERRPVPAAAGASPVSRLLAASTGSGAGLPLAAATTATGKFQFSLFYHPYVCRFIHELNRFGVDGILKRDLQLISAEFFDTAYKPTDLVDKAHLPVEDVDFEATGAYAGYNWELFFFIPLTIAIRLSRNQRFEEAERWFRFVFDPTDTSGAATPKRYWQTRPLFQIADYRAQRIEKLLAKLASDEEDPELWKSVLEWRRNPFNPHAVARLRITVYAKSVVIKYLDHLIAWGDQLFRRDTLESLNEATQVYVLAAEILGRRPERVKSRSTAAPKTYDDLATSSFADLSGPLAAAELLVPETGGDLAAMDGAPPLPRFLLSTFCLPQNEKLLGYWDLVADRLFKLRHCMNIEGVERQLALFEPPIDPALLVRAAASGIDLGSILADVNAVLPHYRFTTMAAKAGELCAEVKSLGAALLSALEKRDAESLSLLRSAQEIRVLTAARQVRERQIDEARETLAGLERARELAAIKKRYYSSRELMNPGEQAHLALSTHALVVQSVAAAVDMTGSVLALIPDVELGVPTTVGFTYGGNNLASGLKGLAGSLGLVAGMMNAGGSLAATLGGYQRRSEEWTFQAELADQEIAQAERQIVAAQVRLAIAERELANHDLQVENALEAEAFLRDKFTNRELYDWMVSQISGVYFQAYQLAYDVARRAEQAYRHELAVDGSPFIRFGHWDSLKKGLLAGEKLYQDLKRMEVSYLDENRREYEITQRFSLSLLDPVALLKLKTTGECFFSLPEAAFDLANPGHYLRRLKSVSLSLPCVTGPYTGVHGTLTLLRSSVRRESRLQAGKYARQENDLRFKDAGGSIQSIVTSGASDDSGLFETSLRDERFLPFEGAGAISEWHLRLPASFRTFDYDTLSDVVLHLRYTAREGGGALRDKAVAELRQALNTLLLGDGRKGLFLQVSARQDFPNAWAAFMNPAADKPQVLSLDLSQDRFPFLVQDRKLKVDGAQVVLQIQETAVAAYTKPGSKPLKVTLASPTDTAPAAGELGSSAAVLGGMPTRTFTPGAPVEVGATSTWKLTALKADVAEIAEELRTPDNRLKPSVVEDLQLVLHYTLAPAT
jgi:hypothetical protein